MKFRLTTPLLKLTIVLYTRPKLRPGIELQGRPGEKWSAGSLSFGFGILMWIVAPSYVRYGWALKMLRIA